MNKLKLIGLSIITASLLGLGFSGCDSSSSNDSNTPNLNIAEDECSLTSVIHNGLTYCLLVSPYTGKTWLDRNLGASEVCRYYDDINCYGDFYQWGRDDDGHQLHSSNINLNQATDVSIVGHGDFIAITTNENDYDWAAEADYDGSLRSFNWSKTDGTSICPIGFRVPKIEELVAETLDISTGIVNSTDMFNHFLKFPSTGYRSSNGSLIYQGSRGIVWSNSIAAFPMYTRSFGFYSAGADASNSRRAYGASVRCIKD